MITISTLPLSKLLGITIQHEKPQLEVQKTELLRKEEELKVQLAELEESLLEVRKNTAQPRGHQLESILGPVNRGLS